jgi:DNA-binding NtrC family response regulator
MGGRSERVLIVDDDESIRALLLDALRDDGYEVDAAASAGAALAAVDRDTPDVIVLDMRMHDDGPAFQQELAKRSLHAPIIAMSASVDGESWAKAIDARYLRKPFLIDDVLSAVRAALATAA